MAYGDSGSLGKVSALGGTVWSPYSAPPVLENTNRVAGDWWRTASSSPSEPMMFVPASNTGSATLFQPRGSRFPDVELVKLHPPRQVRALPGDEVVQDVDGPSLRQESFRDMRSDEAGAAGDEDSGHQRSSSEDGSAGASEDGGAGVSAGAAACSSSANR